jgi:hypothetical protein
VLLEGYSPTTPNFGSYWAVTLPNFGAFWRVRKEGEHVAGE